jgi:putative Ca2+/H+ antiporter (TMEM165/GDT1 family)
MQLPLLASTFATVFLAELGDKTQLAIVTISGTSALVLASLLGAGAGGSLSAVIPADALQLAASVGFLVIGTRLLLKAGQESGTAG